MHCWRMWKIVLVKSTQSNCDTLLDFASGVNVYKMQHYKNKLEDDGNNEPFPMVKDEDTQKETRKSRKFAFVSFILFDRSRVSQKSDFLCGIPSVGTSYHCHESNMLCGRLLDSLGFYSCGCKMPTTCSTPAISLEGRSTCECGSSTEVMNEEQSNVARELERMHPTTASSDPMVRELAGVMQNTH